MTTTATAQRPEYDLTLSDGTTTLGMVAMDQRGQPDPRQLRARPLDRMAIQTTIGESAYSDRVMPYRDIVQEDWSGGSGLKEFDADKSRYYYGTNVGVNKAGKLILAGKATASKTFTGGNVRFFEYKRCLYAVNYTDGGIPYLWRNGYIGAADSNTGQLTKLIDATRSWTVDALIGATVVLIEGPGSQEDQPWRVITDNDATSITVSPAWKITHTTATSYVIVGTDIWTQVSDLGGTVKKFTDVCVADENIYFAYGNSALVDIYNEYNNAGTWALQNSTEGVYADKLVAVRSESENVTYLYGSQNNSAPHKVSVWRLRVPPTYGGLYRFVSEVAPTDVSWSDRAITNVVNSTDDKRTEVTIDAAFTTGVVAVKNLEPPVDITGGNHIAVLIKSSVSTSSLFDLSLLIDDQPDLGRAYYLPQAMYVVDPNQNPRIVRLTYAADGDSTTSEFILPGYYIYIGNTAKFDEAKFDLQTMSAVTNTMTAEYYNGTWTALSITDGTTTGGKSLAQDGSVTWTEPADWATLTVNSNTQYWIRLKFSADVSIGTKVNQVTVQATGTAVYEDCDGLALVKLAADPGYLTPVYAYDGDGATYEPIYLDTDMYLYVGASMIFNKLYVDIKTANGTASVLTGEYFNGNLWTAITITDGTIATGKTMAVDGTISWSPENDWLECTVNSTELYWMRFKVSVAIAVEIYEMRYSRNNNVVLYIYPLVAGVWKWYQIDITPTGYPLPDETQIRSIGLCLNTDLGAQVINLMDGVQLTYTYTASEAYEYKLPSSSPINALAKYNGEETGGVENVWIFTQDGIHEIQQDGSVVRIPLGEIRELATERTGKAWCTNTVYLWFSLAGMKVERYYNKNLDDVGPDGDDGLPDIMRGEISSLLSYPGRVFASIDADTDGNSTIQVYRNNGWHNVYFAETGKRITTLQNQEIRGKEYSRLWFTEDNIAKWINLSVDPENTTGYEYASSGYVIGGWMYGGMRDVTKMFRSVKVFGTLSATATASISYQIDGATSWTVLGTADADGEVLSFAAPYPTGKRIRFKTTLATSSSTTTPVVEAIVLNTYGVVPVKQEYTILSILEDKWMFVDLNYEWKKAWGTKDTSILAWNTLVAWRDNATPLTMRSRQSLFDNITVALNSILPVPMDSPGPEQKNNMERYVVSLSLMDV